MGHAVLKDIDFYEVKGLWKATLQK